MMHNFHNFFFLDYYYCYWCCCSLSTHFASQWIFKITQLVQLSNCILWWILIDLYWIWIKTTNTLPTFKPIFEWNIILIIHVFSISILTQKILIAFASTTLKFKYRSRIQYNTSKQMMMRCLLFFHCCRCCLFLFHRDLTLNIIIAMLYAAFEILHGIKRWLLSMNKWLGFMNGQNQKILLGFRSITLIQTQSEYKMWVFHSHAYFTGDS